MRLQALAEMFNALNHVNVVTLNGVFGAGTYPDQPAADVRTDHGGERSAYGAIGVAVEILKEVSRMFSLLFGIVLAINVSPSVRRLPRGSPRWPSDGRRWRSRSAREGDLFQLVAGSGKTFAPPVKVAEAEIVPLTRHRGPRIAIVGRRIVITAVMGKTLAERPARARLPSDGDLIAWRSEDGGKDWSKGVRSTTFPALRPKACMRSRPTGKATCLPRGSIIAAATARSSTARGRPMAARRGRRTC